MKKFLMSLIVVILLGAGVSTLYRYTGVNLENGYKVGAVAFASYLAMKEYQRKKTVSQNKCA